MLNLPLVSQGATPIDIIRRPPAGEETSNLAGPQQRMYTQASLRILLSDRATDITTLPGIDTTVAPLSLDWSAGAPAGYHGDATVLRSRARIGPFATTPTFQLEQLHQRHFAEHDDQRRRSDTGRYEAADTDGQWPYAYHLPGKDRDHVSDL